MLSGVTVMGHAKKCNELEDRLRNYQVREQFVEVERPLTPTAGGLSDELSKLAALNADGVLTDTEFLRRRLACSGTDGHGV